MCGLKSNEKAVAARAEGNRFYSSRSFHKAMLKYNESLSFAELGSENLGLAYANRSAVYLEMKLYAKCLENIKMARLANYPQENLEVLNKREEKCKTLLMSSHATTNGGFFKLSYPPHRKLPFIAECLELRNDQKYGRHVVTNKSLRVGDIVAIEKPYCGVLLSKSNFVDVPESNVYQRCAHCLKDNSLDLIPCASCCQAMFCSTKCATKKYHQLECPVMERLQESGSVHMAIRLFFIALTVFDGSVADLEKFLKENESKRSTIFDKDSIDNAKSRLLALMSLSRSPRTFSLVQHEEILKSHPEIGQLFEAHQEFIRNFIQSQCQISDSNFHGIFSASLQKTQHGNSDPNAAVRHLQQSIGSGSMLFCSLINHSCANNILRVCVGGKIALVVCRPIPKGSQLFDCYKVNFIAQPKAERQKILLRNFNFNCDCEACGQDFPSASSLTCKDVKLMKLAKKSNDEMLVLQQNAAFARFRSCCDLLEKNHFNFPSIELFLLQKSISVFLLTQARASALFP